MTKTSRLRGGRGGGEDPVVAQECPQDAGPPTGESNDGLDVCAALSRLFEVEVPVRALPHRTCLRGEEKHPSQTAAQALRAVQATAPAAGVTGDPRKIGRTGQVAGVCVGREISCGHDELGPEGRSHAGPGLNDLCLRVGPKRLADLFVPALEPVVQGKDLSGQADHDLRGDVLAGQRRLLSLSSIQGSGRDRDGTPEAAVGQPGSEPGPAAASDRGRNPVAREQDERALVLEVAEGSLQGGEDAGQDIPQAVDHPHPVGRQAAAVGSQPDHEEGREQTPERPAVATGAPG